MNPSGSNHRAEWYPDPCGRYEYRFYNGEHWTADVSTGGTRYVDPFGVASPPQAFGAGVPQPGSAGAQRNRTATAAMVLGIVGATIAWMPFLVVPGGICAALGLTFGIISLRRRRPDRRGFAVAGTVTGAAGLVLVVFGVWTTRVVVDAVDDFQNPPANDIEITRCTFGDQTLIVEGTIENLSRRASDYRIVIGVPGERPLQVRRAVIEAADVAAGETRSFRWTSPSGGPQIDATAEPTCPVIDVTGPLPFGLDVDPD